MKAVKTIVASPHHKLSVEHQVLPAYKARKTDRRSEKWLVNHPEYVQKRIYGIAISKILAVRKQITYDTVENQFTKFILNSTIKQLQDFIKRYFDSSDKIDDTVVNKATSLVSSIKRIISTTFLEDVSEYKSTQNMSLVFEMVPGYRELYKYHLMLKRGLSINRDVFKVSMKDTAQFYEYWCFIKLVSILKKQDYHLFTDDVIKVDRSGVTVTLVKGQASEVQLVNPRTGENITLTYNPTARKMPTVSQKTDNVLTLEKAGAEREYKYVFDAKYRIEARPDSYYPDSNIGPKLDDINTMHRYRDTIVYDSDSTSKFVFKKEMFGAYVLFQYSDEEKYESHHFYKSIDTVNTVDFLFYRIQHDLWKNYLENSLWIQKNLLLSVLHCLQVLRNDYLVLIGLVAMFLLVLLVQKNNLKIIYLNYVPAKYVERSRLPIHYIALYQSTRMFGNQAGIRYYGEVIEAKRLKRSEIKFPSKRQNGDELYYAFMVKNWIELPVAISVKDEGVYEPKFTNLFLIQHCNQSYELFHIHSEVQYRLLHELKRMFDNASINTNLQSEPIYQLDSGKSV